MSLTYKTINRATFPVYLLPSDNYHIQDGLVYIDNALIDDRNMPGKTLGLRRLQTPQQGLRKLPRAVNDLTGVLKQHTKHFIDSNGAIFTYEKTVNCSLRYKRIKKVERKNVASLLWVEGIRAPFTIPRPPSDGRGWAGVLYLKGNPWKLYEYSTEHKKDTRRKV